MIHYLWQVLYWTDTHCHLDMLAEKIVSILEEAKKKEVNRIVTIAIDKKSSKKVCDYVKSYSNVYGAVGIHPHFNKQTISSLLHWLKKKKLLH